MIRSYGTTFVGRGQELGLLGRHVRSGARLISIVGPPGNGKSRLAFEYTALGEACDRAAIHLFDLSDLADARELGQRVRSALDWPSPAPPPAARGMLVLDNFEHLATAAAGTLAEWLARAPDLRLLVTSRERLRVPAEQVLELQPLALPSLSVTDLGEVLASPAGRLFADRAPELVLRPEDGPILVDILHSLDGIPLAIELAAARTAILDLPQLRQRLVQRFELLAHGRPGDGSARRTTLFGAIDWSWSLLSPVEQEALAQCSVFRGSFRLDAAEAVFDLCRVTDRPLSSMDVLHGLAEKSLLRIVRPVDSGEVRFCLYESIRDYAAEKLASSPSRGRIAERHGRYYDRLAEVLGRSGAQNRGGGGLMSRLSLEVDDLLAAYARTLQDPTSFGIGAERGLEYMARFECLLTPRAGLGRLRVMRESAEEAVALTTGRAPADPRARAAILRLMACVCAVLGRAGQAQRLFARALEQADDCRDPAVRARTLYGLAAMLGAPGQEERRNLLAEALALARDADDTALEPHVLAQLANLYLEEGLADEAITQWDRALDGFRRRGARCEEGLALAGRAAAHQEHGRLDVARRDLEAALELLVDGAERRLWAGVLGNLGGVAHEEGALEEADRHYRTAVSALAEVGARRMEGLFLACLGGLCAERDAAAEARIALDAADARGRDYGDDIDDAIVASNRALLDLCLAREAAAAGDVARAAALRRRAVVAIGPVARTSEHLRLARRLVRRALAEGAYVVARDGAWFRTPAGVQVSLVRRPALQRLLAALVGAHGGPVLSSEQLASAGWPGEKMASFAAQNRLQVALTTLRNLGLRELLVREESGYRLGTSAPLVVQP